MPKKYSEETDNKIIKDLIKGVRPKIIREKYKISRSYIYKLKKKINDIT